MIDNLDSVDSVVRYNVTKDNENYIINAKIPLVYDYRNDRPGTTILKFIINKEGEIINKELPELECF